MAGLQIYPSSAGISSPYNAGRVPTYGTIGTVGTSARQRADEEAARALAAQQQAAQIQSPYQQAQTEGLQAQNRAAAQQYNVGSQSEGYSGQLRTPAYEQYVLDQANRAGSERQATAARQEQANREAMAKSAQESLLRLQGKQRQAEMRLQESLMGEREGRRREAIPGILSSIPGIDESRYAQQPIDEGEAAAEEAAFTSARERVGSLGLSALRALREQMAGQGVSGSTMETAGLGGILGDARGSLGEVARDQAISRSRRAGQRADRDVSANLTRRGQDISSQRALQQLILGSIY